MSFLGIDLHSVFAFTVSPLEVMLRGTLMFWFLFVILRFVLRRDVGSPGIGDFLFVGSPESGMAPAWMRVESAMARSSQTFSEITYCWSSPGFLMRSQTASVSAGFCWLKLSSTLNCRFWASAR